MKQLGVDMQRVEACEKKVLQVEQLKNKFVMVEQSVS